MQPAHTNAAILAIGDELTSGANLDTNSQRIARALAEHAVSTTEHATVADEPHLVREALQRMAARNQLIVCTGGLGPTQDDLTRDALAELLNDQLVLDDKQHAQLKKRYESRGRALNPQDRQALRPASAAMLTNHHGTAPGIHAVYTPTDTQQPTDIYLLPGPPNEMVPMLERDVIPNLRTPDDRTISARAIQHFGIAESDAARALGDILNRDRNPIVGITASDGVITTRIRYTGPTANARTKIDDTDRAIAHKIGAYRIAVDAESLYHAAADTLVRTGAALLTAESCTGGLLSDHFTSISGISRAFLGGWITYSNAHKAQHLGVDPDLIDTHGAVSAEVAERMVIGALTHAPRTDAAIRRAHAVAITGIAGPGGATTDPDTGDVIKPVGTVFIAHAAAPVRNGDIQTHEATADVRRFLFPGDRARVRERAASSAAAMVLFHAADKHPPDGMLWQTPTNA